MTIGGLVRAVVATSVAVVAIGVPLVGLQSYAKRSKRYKEKVETLDALDKENTEKEKKEKEMKSTVQAYQNILKKYNEDQDKRISDLENIIKNKTE